MNREVQQNQPQSNDIRNVVQSVRICHAIECSVYSQHEEKQIGGPPKRLHSRDHNSSGERLNKKDERHYRQYVMM